MAPGKGSDGLNRRRTADAGYRQEAEKDRMPQPQRLEVTPEKARLPPAAGSRRLCLPRRLR